MTSDDRLDDSLRWRGFGRREAGQSHAEVARWLQVARKRSPGFGIDSKKWYFHQEGQPRSPHSIDICTGTLLGTKFTTT
ncbi:hypothetical protein TNCV_4306851 [Trichonephila clavipes]|nr:hypothetical protein TNCV_4306851 [Trichonephila clavipes]